MFTVNASNAKVVTCAHGWTGSIFQAGQEDFTKKNSFLQPVRI